MKHEKLDGESYDKGWILKWIFLQCLSNLEIFQLFTVFEKNYEINLPLQ